jgi:dTDP-4-dehydrorhamnose reductase
MIDHFERQVSQQGHVAASRVWFPATSFLEDTAATLFKLSSSAGGLYQVDSNRRWSFFEIATALNDLHGNPWVIIGNHDFTYDQRMLDDRVGVPWLNERLPSLP